MTTQVNYQNNFVVRTLTRIDLVAYAPLIALVVLFFASSVASEYFLSTRNITNILRQVSYTGIIALGATFVIIAAGIDLSVGSMVALVGVVSMYAMNSVTGDFSGVLTAVLVALVVGSVLGAVNGALVTKGRVTAFIVTLATMSIFRSSALYLSDAGEVVGIGLEVKGFEIGDRVSGEGHITCGHCRNCRGGRTHLCRNTVGVGVDRPGAFAEYLVIPAYNAFKLPDEISDDLAAIFDPFGNAVHTALSFDLVGEDVLITGAGPIGIMAAAVAKHVGARHIVITDVNEYRLDLARKMGATRTVDVSKEKLSEVMTEIGMTEGFDVGLEMSGVPMAFTDMLDSMNNGGKIAMLGIPGKDMAIDWSKVIFKGLTIKGIYGREMFETWYKMASLIQSGLDLSPIITHHFSIDDFQQGFDVMRSGQSGKVILNWE